jgi:hypothetical protein
LLFNALFKNGIHERRRRAMAASINGTRTIDAVPQPQNAVEETEASEATRIARYCTLEEMLGLIFGVMTVAYIVLSLASLAL